MTKQELTILQNLDLKLKIAKTKLRIEEWIDYWGEKNVYISFSGGKDSTVLLDLVRQVNPNIQAVFIDTGLEYPQLKEFVKTKENVVTVRPKLSFKQVIEKYGYPVVSKEQSRYIHDIRNSTDKLRAKRLNGDKNGNYKLSKKWHYLIDAPFKISNKCCDVMKKDPVKRYEKETGKKPFIGTMTVESTIRQQWYLLQGGCNAFNNKRQLSTPLAFWREEDILLYIKQNNLEIASIYGDIVEENGKLRTTKCARTGCTWCLYGIHLEKYPNRLQVLKQENPNIYKYCMDNLGLEEVCKWLRVDYK